MNKIVQLFGQHHTTEIKERVDISSFRCDIIRPALKVCDLWSTAAENLLLGTALAESGLRVVKQMKGGDALSFFQVEPKTYIDCLRYLSTPRCKHLKDKILAACFMDVFPDASALQWNLRLATLIARTKYWMKKEPLPESNDADGLCKYYKKHYNTSLGKATFEKAIVHFNKSCKETGE